MKINKIKLIILLILISCFIINVVFSDTEIQNENLNDDVMESDDNNIDSTANSLIEDEQYLKDMEMVCRNEFLELFINKETTEIAVRNKKTGDVWYSNPPDRDKDAIAAGINRDLLNSQLSITYHTPTAKKVTMNNFSDSIRHKQYKIKQLQNGVKIIYTIGKTEKFFILPLRLTQKRFKQILETLGEEQQTALKRRYTHISLNKVKNDKTKKELLEKYPILENMDIYELKQGLNEVVLGEVEDIFKSINYTIEDLNNDHIEAQLPPIEKEATKEIFEVAIEYCIEDDNLIISIPVDEIKHDKSYPVVSIDVLQFFGSAGENETGYMLVPDGSGALIYLNNGKTKNQPYISPVYGYDASIRKREIFERANKIHLPVYGIKKENKAVLAIIEGGSSFSTIKADVSGRVNSYNNVYSSFTVLPNDVVDLHQMAGNNIVMVYQPKKYEGTFKIRYAFLSGQDADYVGMAKYYRKYLVRKGDIKKKDEDKEGLPFYLELIGSVDRIKPVWGIPRRVVEPLTTFEQAKLITQQLIDNGVKDIKLKYTGWFNGGVRHSYPSGINVQKELGGMKGLRQLTDFLSKNKVDFYPDACFLYVYQTKLFDGFIASRDSARFLDRETALIYDFNPATNIRDMLVKPYYIVNPNRLGNMVDAFIKSYQKLNIDAISLRNFGTDLNSNFREKSLSDREKTKEIITGELDKLKTKGYDIMTEGGNDYVLKYASHILNMPFEGSNYNICDESIPFYQIVVRGYVNYAGEPINLASEYNKAVLKTVETGSGIYFTWMFKDNASLKNTDYNYYYSANYKIWFEKATTLYNDLNSQLHDIKNREIIDHKKLIDNVYMTKFDGGKSVIVNYRNKDVKVYGKTIKAKSYIVLEGVN